MDICNLICSREKGASNNLMWSTPRGSVDSHFYLEGQSRSWMRLSKENRKSKIPLHEGSACDLVMF